MTKKYRDALQRLLDQVNAVVIGKAAQVQDSVTCILAGGHLLIEDIPGVGKTTLARALAMSLGLQFSRVQFTSDMMPSDLLGVSVYEKGRETFVFHPGPIFTQVLLADEINRAGPKTQSALLEAMEEQQVSIEGETRHLPEPFFVIATQNPTEQLGTYPLPESQLDRFLMCIHIGYPDRASEQAILRAPSRNQARLDLSAALTPEDLRELQAQVRQVHVSEAVLGYLQDVIDATRSGQWFVQGLSTRAGLALLRAAQARAWMSERDYVAPDDIQAVLPQVLSHRLVPLANAGRSRLAQVQAMTASVALR